MTTQNSTNWRIGVNLQAWDTGLDALAAFNTNGIIVQTSNNTYAGRTITGTANQIVVTNGDGVSGNPTLAIPYNVILGSSSAGPSSVTFNEDTDNGANFGTLVAPAAMAGNRTWTFQDATGTIAFTSDITGTNSGTNTGDQLVFKTISVSGQSDVVADSATDTLTLVGGTNVTITTNASTDTITISAASGALAVVHTTGTSATLAVETNYFADNVGLVTYTLPASAAVGQRIRVRGQGAGGWTIVENSGQIIHFGNQDTTVDTGSLSSTAQYDSVDLECMVTDTDFIVVGSQGEITVV